jgi:alpha-mannosidase
LPAAIDQFNRSAHPPFKAHFAVPEDFESLVAKRTDRPVIRGELNPVYQGGYSSRIDVKQTMREVEGLLISTEKLSVIGSVAGGKALDSGALERAWEPVLFNQAIDIVSGTVSDRVYEETMERYGYARRFAREASLRASESVVAHVDTSGKGVPIEVFNTLSWQRTDIAEVDVAFSDPGVHEFTLFDADGVSVPVQVLSILRNDDGGISQARIAFIARKIPALGYAIYHAAPSATGLGFDTTIYGRMFPQDVGSIENEFYRATFDLATGAMTSLVLKEDNWEALAGPGNVVAREYDGGDLWELNGTLNGFRGPAITKPIGTPRQAYTQWSSDFLGGLGTVSTGPVFSEFYTAGLYSNIGTRPFGKNQFATRVRLYKGLRRIDISTVLVNQEEFVRYRAIFPTAIVNGTATHEIPFGAIQRPHSQEFPAQNWIDYSDGRKGLTLINRGIPGNNLADGELMLSLMRSARMLDYPVGAGGYESGAGSDGGLGVGRRYTFEYALVPHKGDWRSAGSWRDGMEFNSPLMARMVAPHDGELPSKWGLLGISQDNVVISALKPGKGGTVVLRVYEAAGRPARGVWVSFRARIGQVNEANLLEEAGSEIKSAADGFSFDLKPFEIRTFKLTVSSVNERVPMK